MDYWVEFYERVIGMTNIIHFGDEDIQTEYSALMSKVMADGSGKIKFPINEPAEGKRKSQIQEYLDYYGGPGVAAHRARDDDIVGTVESAEGARLRLPRHAGLVLRRRAASASGRSARTGTTCSGSHPRRPRRRRLPAPDLHEDGAGPADALLRGDRAARRDGFGEGNFKALFEAIEREQALRGNL